MRLSNWKSDQYNGWQGWLPPILWVWTLLLLIMPNIGLALTDTLLPAGADGIGLRIAFIILPLGCYMMLLSAIKRVGIAFWTAFPLIFLSAFQMVLLDLFGSQPIAVDMWLNLATTNATEANELLGSLLRSMVMLTVVYIPAIILAIIATAKGWRLKSKALEKPMATGIGLAIAGLAMTLPGVWMNPSVTVVKSLYPVNVVYNACLAAERTAKVAHYHETSRDFSFGATSSRPDSISEVYVIVIGETARSDHFQLYGYNRPTTPRLMQRAPRIAWFHNTLSESNTTHKSVPMLLSHLDSRTFENSIYTSKSILTAFNEAGFSTAFISNQGRNGSFIDFFGEEADTTIFLKDGFTGPTADAPRDLDLLTPFTRILEATKGTKLAVVLHAYGSHFKYDDRYPNDFNAPFKVGHYLKASPSERDNLVNAYDNTIAYTDLFLSSLIDTLEATSRPSAIIYTSDHGEDLYDDNLQRFLHASPLPTYPQVRVPMLIWCSSAYDGINPTALTNARAVGDSAVSSTRSLFHTIIELAGIDTQFFHPEQSVVNRAYTAPPYPLYLNDHNEPVRLTDIVLIPSNR